jgi:hypothetical protein
MRSKAAPLPPAFFPTFFLLVFFLAACSDTRPRTRPLTDGTIDTFDDGDRTNVLGRPWQGISEGSGSRVDLLIQEGGYGDSAYHLVVDGFRPLDATSSHVVGTRVSVTETPPPADPNRAELTADVRSFSGLAFAIRGTPGTYIIQIGSALIQDFDHYNTYVEANENWTEFRIPFDRFQQEGFGRAYPWSGEYINYVAFYANLTGSFSFGVDQVRFY